MRRNAQGYKDTLAAGQVPVSQIIANMRADATEYRVRRLEQYTRRIFVNHQAKAEAGLAALGMTRTEGTALYNELKAAADAFQTAADAATTAAHIIAAADALLAAVTAHVMVFD